VEVILQQFDFQGRNEPMRTLPLGLVLTAVITAAVLCIVVKANAQPPTDVPRIAQDEIARRGSHVEQTGTIRSGAAAAALSPPTDDSSKWFLTLVVRNGEPASERMKAVIARDPAMRPWVNAQDPAQSPTHYQIRAVDDRTQADWLEGLQPAIARGLPLVIVQPPRSGRFGPSATIVKMIPGVHSGEELSRRLRDGIVAYVETIEQPGISQPAGAAPPFPVPPKDAPEVPFEWPPADAANPSEPAQESPILWPALMAIGSYPAGWLSARLKTWAGAKVAELSRALDALKTVPRDPK